MWRNSLFTSSMITINKWNCDKNKKGFTRCHKLFSVTDAHKHTWLNKFSQHQPNLSFHIHFILVECAPVFSVIYYYLWPMVLMAHTLYILQYLEILIVNEKKEKKKKSSNIQQRFSLMSRISFGIVCIVHISGFFCIRSYVWEFGFIYSFDRITVCIQHKQTYVHKTLT